MDLDTIIAREKELAMLCQTVVPDNAKEHNEIANWLTELKDRRATPTQGISICILTYNILFYNKLTMKMIREMTRVVNYEVLVLDNASTDGSYEWLGQQKDVRLFRAQQGSLRHGAGLDFLVKQARYPICCTLCSDAFPVSPEWLVPVLYLDDKIFLTGAHRKSPRLIPEYVCPSYLFGWTDWLRRHSFCDDWPKADTGEHLGKACLDEEKQMKFWEPRLVDLGNGISPKENDYAGLVWHTWWSGRKQSIPGIVGQEVEANYHDAVVDYLRKRFNLDF